MGYSMRHSLHSLCALVFALAPASMLRCSDAPTPSGAGKVVLNGATFSAARNGQEILLSWDLPELEIRLLELVRNDQREQKGRGRIATLRVRPGLYTDHVPDPAATYWYWLKITLADGSLVGLGPVETPQAEVWNPE